jgi:hypothetical protein
VSGVSDPDSSFTISITGVDRSKPIIPNPLLYCPNAFFNGSTALVKTTNQSIGLGSMLGFKATDKIRGTSCTGAVGVCVQDLLHAGKPCTGTATYDATECKL